MTKTSLAITILFIIIYGCKKHEAPYGFVPEIVTTESGIKMAMLPGGEFAMGGAKGEADEKPVHRVKIDPFMMDVTEITQESYEKKGFPNASHFKGADMPVEQVTWLDAIMFCNERSIAEGLEPCYELSTGECDFTANGYRLPTEAEWEYACRARSGEAYCFGNSALALREYGWYAENAGGQTHSVASLKPNAWGLYDLHGNVAEWCHDFYRADYYADSLTDNPTGPDSGRERVLRGGSWSSNAGECRSGKRGHDASINDSCTASDRIGFRCVRHISD